MLMQAYTDYFENLAATHKDILHKPESVTADSYIGERRFAIYNADDVLAQSLRTKIGFPALMAELYEFDFTRQEVYDPKASYRAAFSIVCQGSAKDLTSETRALATAERIMWDMVQKIYADHYTPGADRCASPFKSITVTAAAGMAFGPVWDYCFGWRFEFSFVPKMERSLTTPPEAGTFV